MTAIKNPELELAFRFVNETNRHIFLTGKAGTGKTTFLKKLRTSTKKRNVVVAPTGVAAINAGGMTIHSLFQLPFGLLIPGQKRKTSGERKMKRTKINLLRSLDLLIIDEISMVRADIMDAIDEVLKRYRNSAEPFGGVQLLMIGDLHQLPPVVRNNERSELFAHFRSEYFFSSNSITQSQMIIVELKHVYRQSDQHFINILNEIRNNKVSSESLAQLNNRYEDGASKEDRGIILTSHRNTSAKINNEKLADISSKPFVYTAEIDGIFSESSFPNDEKVTFKMGAKVMFVKNDPSEQKLYYNGKIGEIIDLDEDLITVKCDDGVEVEVAQATWENTTFELNEKTKTLEEKVLGSFTQYPLKLAWAITIHKSQGLTFDQVVIDAQDAFAHGQVYVALSRCKTLEGITLISKIQEHGIKTAHTVHSFEEQSKDKSPTVERLNQAIKEYESYLLMQLFDFGMIKSMYQTLLSTFSKNVNSIVGDAVNECHEAGSKLLNEGVEIADKFQFQLYTALQENQSITQNEVMMKRLKGSGDYFYKKLKEEFYPQYAAIKVVSDNNSVEEKLDKQLDELKKELYIRGMTFKALKNGFSTQALITARANAEIDYTKRVHKTPPISTSEALKEVTHKKLYENLSAWRDYESSKTDQSQYKILSTRSLIELSDVMPRSTVALKLIKGISKTKVEKYGEVLLKIVAKYCDEHNLSGEYLQHASKAKKRETIADTQKESVDLYLEGKTIKEIAENRLLATTTIDGHLAEGVRHGLLEIDSFMTKEKREAAKDYFESVEDKHLSPARQKLGDQYSFGELKMVLAWMSRKKKEETEEGE